MAYVICITGNIASGKSTLAQFLAQQFANAVYIPEPHDENPFLPMYLLDKSRWAFTAQLRYFYDYVRVFAEADPDSTYRFVDTGLWTNLYVYVRYLMDHWMMRSDEHEFYQTLTTAILRAYQVPKPHAYLFVIASPQVCWERMIQRGWAYQVNAIDLRYVETLHGYFARMQAAVGARTPTLALSSEALDFTSEIGQQEVLRRVQRFFDSHQITHP